MNLRCLSGFTLVELAVVLALITAVGTFATPSVVLWHKRDQSDARARAMMSILTLVRSKAIRRGARVTLCRIDAAPRVSRGQQGLRRRLDRLVM